MDNKSDIIDKLTAVGLKTNWGLVDRVDCVPEPVEVIRDAIGEILTLREALCEACILINEWNEHCPKWYFDDACDSALVNCKQSCCKCWNNFFIKYARAKMSDPEMPAAAELWGKGMNTGGNEQ